MFPVITYWARLARAFYLLCRTYSAGFRFGRAEQGKGTFRESEVSGKFMNMEPEEREALQTRNGGNVAEISRGNATKRFLVVFLWRQYLNRKP